MKIGILGCSKVFEDSIIRPQIVEVVGIASRSLEKAQFYAEKYHLVVYNSYNSLIEDKDIDAVYIALPPVLQVEWAIRAIEHGKRVLVEKPLSIYYHELIPLERVLKSSGGILLEGVMTQHHEWNGFINNIVSEEKYGKINEISTIINMIMPDEKLGYRKDEKLGGGVFFDQASYWLQFVQSLVGLNFSSYDLDRRTYKSGVDWDVFFRGTINDVKIYFEASYEKKYEVSHVLNCERATIRINNFFRAAMGDYKITVEVEDNMGIEKHKFLPQNYYRNQLKTFEQLDIDRSRMFWEETKERIYWLDKIGHTA